MPGTKREISSTFPVRLTGDSSGYNTGGAPEDQLRILLFGDGFTARFVEGRVRSYGEALARSLGPAVAIWACGYAGLEASDLVDSMDAEEVEDNARHLGKGLRCLLMEQRFDLVLVMAGFHDLAEGYSPPAAVSVAVQCVHSICHAAGVRTVALSIPPSRVLSRSAKHQTRHGETNRLLKDWVESIGRFEGAVAFVDLATLLSGEAESDNFDAKLEQQLGSGLASMLRPLISQPQTLAPLPNSDGVPMPQLLEVAAFSDEPPLHSTRPLRLLFYGDSLTAGFHACGRLFAPYGEAFGRTLKLFKPHELWVCGLSGLTAVQLASKTGQAKIRDAALRHGPGIRRLLEDHGRFDLALIMLGTNDLSRFDAKPIADAIKSIHLDCHKAGTPTAALLIPPSAAVERYEDLAECRYDTNEQLKAFAGEKSMVTCVETEDLLPFSRDTEHWEPDGLHFSRRGSQALGQALAEQLGPMLMQLHAGKELDGKIWRMA